MDKENVVYMYIYTHIHIGTHNGILFSHKKKEILPFVTTWMDLEGSTLNEISQTEKDKCYLISLTGGILKKQANKKRSYLWLPEAGG